MAANLIKRFFECKRYFRNNEKNESNMHASNLLSWNDEKTKQLTAAVEANHLNINVPAGYRRAGVLLPLYMQHGVLTTIYIRRTRHFLSDGREAIHSGQIAFPGGKIENGETLQEAALREAVEEVGLAPEKVSMLSKLGTFVTLTSNFASTVYIGWLHDKPELSRNKREVAAIYHIPLHEIADQHRSELNLDRLADMIALHYHWQPPDEKAPVCIWGMTSRVTWQLFSVLGQIEDQVALMAKDPEMQTELKSIHEEFSQTENNGLERL